MCVFVGVAVLAHNSTMLKIQKRRGGWVAGWLCWTGRRLSGLGCVGQVGCGWLAGWLPGWLAVWPSVCPPGHFLFHCSLPELPLFQAHVGCMVKTGVCWNLCKELKLSWQQAGLRWSGYLIGRSLLPYFFYMYFCTFRNMCIVLQNIINVQIRNSC